jgi:hypothetical protein
MFAHRFFAARLFAPRYFPPVEAAPAPAPSGEGRYYFQRRHFAQSDLWREDEEIIILKP